MRGKRFTISYPFPLPDTGRGQFTCLLKCGRCTATSVSTGQRCKRRVCIGVPVCFTHLYKNHNLRIRDAKHGKGLFAQKGLRPQPRGRRGARGATILFRKNEVIIPYGGETLTDDALNRRYPQETPAVYGLVERRGRMVRVEDGACVRGIGTLANDYHGSGKTANARFAVKDGKFVLVATCNIHDGSEILVTYRANAVIHFDRRRYRVKVE